MKTYGVIIWMKPRTGAMIVWCADSKGLAYVPASALDEADAFRVGDTVDVVLVGVGGGLRLGSSVALRDCRTGRALAAAVRDRVGRTRGPVIARAGSLARGIGFDPEFGRVARDLTPANMACCGSCTGSA